MPSYFLLVGSHFPSSAGIQLGRIIDVPAICVIPGIKKENHQGSREKDTYFSADENHIYLLLLIQEKFII